MERTNFAGGEFEVINGMTDTGWLDHVKRAMKGRRDIVLMLAGLSESERKELNGAASEEGYGQAEPVTEAEWSEMKVKLDLTPLGTKEQGINRNFVYRLSRKQA